MAALVPSTDLRYIAKTIMFADVVESVRLIQLDEQGAATRIRTFLRYAAEELVPTYRGTLVEHRGDGLLVTFDEARDAVACATALQRTTQSLATTEPHGSALRIRIGIHTGDVLTDGEKYYGHGVNMASRLMTVAGPQETIVSAFVRDRLTNGLDGDIEDLGLLAEDESVRAPDGALKIESIGEVNLKHVQGPVRAYRVGEVGPDPVVPPGTSEMTDLRPCIAVLPFSHYQGDSLSIGVGDVISDQIISALSLNSGVRVISRLSSQAFRGRSVGLAETAATLGASYVLSGRYWEGASTLTVNVELAAVRSGQVEWADSFSCTTADVLNPNGDCVARIASGVMNSIVRSELRVARALALPNLDSHTLYLAATVLLHRFSRADFERAHAMLLALQERAPRHAHPLAWLARWHVFRAVQGWSTDMDSDRQEALSYAHRAIDIDPESSLALTIAGSVHVNMLKDLDGALSLYRQALDINPNESLAWILLGTAQTFRGSGDEALVSCRRGIDLSPIDPIRFFYDNLAAGAAVVAQNYRLGLQYAERSVRANRLHSSSLRTLAICQGMLGLKVAAQESVRQLLRIDPTLTAETYITRLPFADQRLAHRMATALVQAGLPAGAFVPEP